MSRAIRAYPLIIASSYVILEKPDQTICLTRRCNTGYMDTLYALPAGHKEAGEYPKAGAIREVREEVGVEIQASNLELVHIMHRLCGGHERTDFFYVARTWRGEVHNREPDRCDDVIWRSLDKLPSNTVPYIREALLQYQIGQNYSEVKELSNTTYQNQAVLRASRNT